MIKKNVKYQPIALRFDKSTKNDLLMFRYMEKAKEVSRLYHDRPVPAGKEIVHWVEHVVATGGALHLRSPALMLPWYQKMYLDLLALTILGVFIFIYLIKVIKYLRRSKRVNEAKKKQ